MSTDRIKSGLTAFVRSVTQPTDYFALYPCRVVAQNADLTLELRPDDGVNVPSTSRVPVRTLPGVTVEVAPGARVQLAFEGGDPSRPIATIFEPTSLLKLHVDASVLIEFGTPAIDAAVKGTTYRAAEDAMLSSLATALGLLNGILVAAAAATDFNTWKVTLAPAATAIGVAQAAINTFQSGASTYLSPLVKLK